MWLPANSFNNLHEARGNAASTSGTTVTAGAGSKGSWVNLGGATSFAYEGFTLYFVANSAPLVAQYDIGIDSGGGNYTPLAIDMYAPLHKTNVEHNHSIYFPIHVPSGATIGLRVQSTLAITAQAILVGHAMNPGGFPGFSRAINLTTMSSSRGVTIDPGSTAARKGSWTQLIASSSAPVHAVALAVGGAGDVTRTAVASMLLDIGVGASNSEVVRLPNIYLSWGPTFDTPFDVRLQPMPCYIPSGSRVAARAACTDTTAGDRTVDVVAMGFVP